MRARLMLLRSGVAYPPSGRGVVVVDGSGGSRAAGIGGWLVTSDGRVESWCHRTSVANISRVEIAALVYGAHRAMSVDSYVTWSIYSDRASVAEELVEIERPGDPVRATIDLIVDGRVLVEWIGRESEIMQSADALARAGRLLPDNPIDPMRLTSMIRESSG